MRISLEDALMKSRAKAARVSRGGKQRRPLSSSLFLLSFFPYTPTRARALFTPFLDHFQFDPSVKISDGEDLRQSCDHL